MSAGAIAQVAADRHRTRTLDWFAWELQAVIAAEVVALVGRFVVVVDVGVAGGRRRLLRWQDPEVEVGIVLYRRLRLLVNSLCRWVGRCSRGCFARGSISEVVAESAQGFSTLQEDWQEHHGDLMIGFA